MESSGAGIRTRWAAIGAAVAVSVGAGGIGIATATISSGERPVFVSITPCRLIDTRPAPTTVGGRGAPLAAGETAMFAVHGSNGNCTIPAGAVSIAANVTITDPTSDSFMTVFPADASLPTSSNLNWVNGQAPTPNAITVDLSSDGSIKVFNERGTVNLIVDITGYYEDHNHDDRYYTREEADAAFDTLWAVVAANGSLLSGSHVVSAAKASPPQLGRYLVEFDRDVSQCAYLVTNRRNNVDTLLVVAFSATQTVPVNPNAVFVYGEPAVGAEEDFSFSLAVHC